MQISHQCFNLSSQKMCGLNYMKMAKQGGYLFFLNKNDLSIFFLIVSSVFFLNGQIFERFLLIFNYDFKIQNNIIFLSIISLSLI